MKLVNGDRESIGIKNEKINKGLYIMVISITIGYLVVFNGLFTRVNSNLFLFAGLSIFIAPILSGWILIFGSNILSEQTLKLIESFTTVGSTFSVGMLLLSRVSYGECGDVSFMDSWHCNPHFRSNSLPQDTGKLI